MKRASIYFGIGLLLEFGLLLVPGVRYVVAILLSPGLALSGFISHGDDTSNFSFVLGLVLNAALYALVGVLIERVLRRRLAE